MENVFYFYFLPQATQRPILTACRVDCRSHRQTFERLLDAHFSLLFVAWLRAYCCFSAVLPVFITRLHHSDRP